MYLDKKTGKNVKAEQVKEGLWTVTYEDGTQKDVADATFKRWFSAIEAAEGESAAPASAGTNNASAEPAAQATADAAPAAQVAADAPAQAEPAAPVEPAMDPAQPAGEEDAAKVLSFDEWVAEHYPNLDFLKEQLTRDKSTEEAQAALDEMAKNQKIDYKSYLKNQKGAAAEAAKAAEKAQKEAEAAAKKDQKEKEKAEKEAKKAAEKEAREAARKAAQEAARSATGEFTLVSHDNVKTAKGAKIIDVIGYAGQTITITEYGGFITDVRVADANGTEVYKSPKMSLKDTLTNHFGLTDDKFKVARSAVTTLRKNADKPAEAKPEENKEPATTQA